MKTQQLPIRLPLNNPLVTRIFTSLIIVSLLLNATKSFSLSPDSAKVTELQGQGITVNDREIREITSDQQYILKKFEDVLAVPYSFGQTAYAHLALIKNNPFTTTTIEAIAQGNATTYYYFPCTGDPQPGSELVIEWSNGINSPCGKGMRIVGDSYQPSYVLNNQGTRIAKLKNLDKNQLWLNAQGNNNPWRYYCSYIPNSSNGSGKIAAGLTSIQEACWQSQNICEANNISGCSLATLGKWNLNDSNLMMSVTCADGKSSSRRVHGSQISSPGTSGNVAIQQILRELLGDVGIILGQILDIQPRACYLEVYDSDEILISPVGTQTTKVVTTGLESGQVQIDVIKGRVKLRSTEQPQGRIARQGDSYVFRGQGTISVNEGGQTSQPPSSTGSLNAPARFFLRFSDAYLVHVPRTKTLQITAQNNVLSYGQDWNIRQVNPYTYDLRQANWRDFYWRVDTVRQAVYRVQTNRISNWQSNLMGQFTEPDGERLRIGVEVVGNPQRPTRFFLRFSDAYLVHVPGTQTLQITAQNNVLSYGQGWDIRQVNPYTYHLRRGNWRDFYWKVDTSIQRVYRVRNGIFGDEGGQAQPLNINVESIN